MNLPLSADTRSVLKDEAAVLRSSNLGLLFNRYVFSWTSQWTTEEKIGDKKVNKKADFLKKIVDSASSYKTTGNDCVSAANSRQNAILTSFKSSGWQVESFELRTDTDSRLIIGLGSESVIETGLTLHPVYGFPYLPASGLKGLARAFAEIADGAAASDLREVFGSEDKDPRRAGENQQGKVFFLDGLPTAFPRLELDIMNPHYSDYYQGKKDNRNNPIPPADYLKPVPVTFLAVASGQAFSFAVFSRDEALARKARQWLIGGLTELGAGGKTNVGYGYFRTVERMQTGDRETPATQEKERPVVKEDQSLAARVKRVRNPQTFVEFLKGIQQAEFEELRRISLSNTAINMGVAGELESADVSPEIKRIIAAKILEVTSPNKKWDEKKREKYRKLQSMAGR